MSYNYGINLQSSYLLELASSRWYHQVKDGLTSMSPELFG